MLDTNRGSMSEWPRKDTETIENKNNNRQEQPVFKQFKNPTKENIAKLG